LERPVGAGGRGGFGGTGVAEADGQVERGLPPRHVAAVDGGGHGVRHGLARDGLVLGGHLARARQAREGGDQPAERRVVAPRHGKVRRAVRVLGDVFHGAEVLARSAGSGRRRAHRESGGQIWRQGPPRAAALRRRRRRGGGKEGEKTGGGEWSCY
jgi:hypothetical protein